MRTLSLTTILALRRAALALVAALEAAAQEAYGWTPRGSSTAARAVDNSAILERG